MIGHRPRERTFAAAWFALGFLATICQVLLLRDFLVICSGSELGIALLLCTWLVGIAVGAAISIPLQRAGTAPFVLLPLCLTALALSCPAGLAAVRLAVLLAETPAGSLAPLGQLAGVALTAVLPPGLLVGLAFPLACAAEAVSSGRGSTSIGRVYAWEAAGSFCAGLVHTWLLVTLLPAMRTALLSAALLCLTAAWLSRRQGDDGMLGRLRTAVRWSAGSAGILLLTAGLLPLLGTQLDRLTLEWRWSRLHPGIRLLETLETPYQRLEAGQMGDQTVFVANGSVLSTYPDQYSAALWGHLVLSAHPAPRRVLLVGGLESGLLAAMLLHPGVREIRCLEQDPALPALYGRYARGDDRLALADPRYTLTSGDGRQWINRQARGVGRGATEPWDLVVILLPDPTTARINRYYTREFYAACRRLLKPDGVLLCRATASANYLEDEAGALARSVYATLGRVFPMVRAAGGDRLIFAAANHETGPGFFTGESLVRNYRSSGANDPGFSPMSFHSLVEDQRADYLEDTLTRDQPGGTALVNTDWRPLAQTQTLRLWSRFSGDTLDQLLRLLFLPLPHWLAAALLALPLLWSLAPLVHRCRPDAPRRHLGSTAVIVFTAGFVGLAMELICIQVYQGAFGDIYRMIGSVIALFMLGLALGGSSAAPLARRFVRRLDQGHRRVLAAGLGGQALLALGAPAALHLAGSGHPLFAHRGLPEALVLLLVCGAGWFTGLVLPAAAGRLLGYRQPDSAGSRGFQQATARASAMVNSADHLGAAAAAALVGLAAIPRLGVTTTSAVLALLSLCCAVRLLLEPAGPGASGS
jgi:spermidine synthase